MASDELNSRKALTESIQYMSELNLAFLVVIFVLVVCLTSKGELKSYQELKNKRRFSGKRLAPNELAELDKFAIKY